MIVGSTVDTRRPACIAAWLCALALIVCPSASANPITDPAAFMTAISGLPGTVSTLDFETPPAGTTIPNGDSMGGITFTSSIGLDLIVSTGFETTSGSNYLGVDDGGDEVFLPPTDLWEMSFATPLQAIGIYIVSSDALLAGDVRLETAAGIVENSGTANSILADGGNVYFLGLISNGAAFSNAQVRYGAGVLDFFVYNVDDITTVTDAAAPVPEPSSMLLLSTGLAALWARRRSTTGRRRHQGVTNA
jgi:hypothetical protein